jgi:hypothetical protein
VRFRNPTTHEAGKRSQAAEIDIMNISISDINIRSLTLSAFLIAPGWHLARGLRTHFCIRVLRLQ